MTTPGAARSRGVTLIELIIFIVLVSIAMSALMLTFKQFNAASVDPLLRKQALAVAESLLEEIQLMPFTFCDPTDANVATAQDSAIGGGSTHCASLSEDLSGTPAIGPEAGQTRYSTTTPFNNVSDYNTFSMTGIKDITNTSVSSLTGYSASVTVAQSSLGGIAASESLRITVTVTVAGTSLVLDGYRTRYAPNTAP